MDFWLAGALLVQLRLLANLYDGMVAVLRQIASPVDELFNEVPDRVSRFRRDWRDAFFLLLPATRFLPNAPPRYLPPRA